jgi:hypothetical protein
VGSAGGAHGLDPAWQISPTVELPFTVPSTAHVTAWLLVPVTVAERLSRRFVATSANVGETATATPLVTVIVALADWVASAWLVAVMVIGLMGGRLAGAVYTAVAALVEDRVPQELPAHCDPEMAQVTAWLSEIQTVAVNDSWPPSPTVAAEGEMEIAGEQLGAIVIAAAADCEGSATLVAVSVTLGVEGTVEGAVYSAISPLAETEPQLPELHAGPARFQVTPVAGLPEPLTAAVKSWLAPITTFALVGETVTCTLLTIVTLAEPLLDGLARLVAVTVMVAGVGRIAGAV